FLACGSCLVGDGSGSWSGASPVLTAHRSTGLMGVFARTSQSWTARHLQGGLVALTLGCGTAPALVQPGQDGHANTTAARPATGAPCDPNFLAACDAQCSRGDGRSCLFMGLVLQGAQGGVPVDEGRSLQYHMAACGAREAAGCMFAGMLLLQGKTVPKDVPRAYSLLQQACAGGNGDGCVLLGSMIG